MKRGRTVRMKGVLEADAFTRWRRVMSWGSGTLAWVKRNYNKRARQAEKEKLRMEVKAFEDEKE